MFIALGENGTSQKKSKIRRSCPRIIRNVGVDAPAWTTALIQQYLDETYDAEYSIPNCRRLLREAGLTYQKPRRTAAESDADEQETFREELKKSGGKWTPQ